MKKRMILLVLILINLFFLLVFNLHFVYAGHAHSERYYQEAWCEVHEGETEVVLPDRTRIDCLTTRYAIEFDFAGKWAEAIGQALHYGRCTGRIPGIVLIIEKETDHKYTERIKRVKEEFELPIKIWEFNAY